MSTLLHHHQRSLILWKMGTNTETQHKTVYSEWETLEHSVPNWMPQSNSSHKGPENSAEECKSQRSGRHKGKKRPYKHKNLWTYKHRNWGSMHRACMGVHQMGSWSWSWKWTHAPILQKLFPTDNHLQEKRLLFSRGVPLWKQITVKDRPNG